MLANVAAAVQAIMRDAAQAFAGVFAFLARTMGPAAAAQATVSAAAIFAEGTDYVLRGGLALIHPGETLHSWRAWLGAFTGAGMGATRMRPPASTSLHSQSVARFFHDNSRHMPRDQ